MHILGYQVRGNVPEHLMKTHDVRPAISMATTRICWDAIFTPGQELAIRLRLPQSSGSTLMGTASASATALISMFLVLDSTPSHPSSAIECCERSLKRLGVSVIDLYYIHRIDPSVPIEETMYGLAKLKQQGKIRAIGLSEASADTLRRAHAVVPVDAHQVEYSPFELSIEHEETGILKTSRELGITIIV